MSQGKKLKKIVEAEDLALAPSEEVLKIPEKRDVYQERLEKAIKIYKELCLSPVLGVSDKMEAVVSFLKFVPGEGREMLIKLRDMISFVSGKERDDLTKLLEMIIRNPGIDSHE